jgi:hypothetical protein
LTLFCVSGVAKLKSDDFEKVLGRPSTNTIKVWNGLATCYALVVVAAAATSMHPTATPDQ